ncbi:hypothetical protein P152DRAFT_433358 [Eremomyces bilateralis CBS 781.70]|uniref:HTH CENPB-type domain-containing protein n=1 Tax=Eremomyces bilateralis CBS 781.70 TaxID=1392243 RepID=A0A6G1G719_9PEZI|nr:uncharacterized protein P152DRAFT_433358 [Eremomyces bilateralis CBS 781.70]KAF1813824.1 hypothetical protein P152DRAFT_433358 [Eremomyces bilateralis CBS 781.70]
MPPVNEVAIQAFHDEKFNSLNQCADEYGIKRSTLRSRLNGSISHQDGAKRFQKLSPYQEKWLVEWIIEEEVAARAPSYARVRQMAEAIARENGDDAPCGNHWTEGHSTVRLTINCSILGTQ